MYVQDFLLLLHVLWIKVTQIIVLMRQFKLPFCSDSALVTTTPQRMKTKRDL